jgi:hypothetical protein
MKPSHWIRAAAPLPLLALFTAATAAATPSTTATPAASPATPTAPSTATPSTDSGAATTTVNTPAKTAAPASTAAKPAAATPVAPAAPPPPPPPAPPPPAQVDFEAAQDFVAHKKNDKATALLDELPNEEGYTPILANKVRLLRAQMLLGQRHPDTEQAEALILRVLHEDREGALLADTSDDVKAMGQDLKEKHVFVLDDTVPVTRPGRPLKFRAHVVEPEKQVTVLKLHLSPHGLANFTETTMKHDSAGWSFLLREPESLAPEGVTDDYMIDYFLTGQDATGTVLDSDGSSEEPRQTLFSNAKTRSSEVAKGVDLNVVTRAEAAPPVVVAPPAETPWYARWYSITAGSVIGAAIIATVVTVAVEATKPPPALPSHLTELCFPASPCPGASK